MDLCVKTEPYEDSVSEMGAGACLDSSQAKNVTFDPECLKTKQFGSVAFPNSEKAETDGDRLCDIKDEVSMDLQYINNEQTGLEPTKGEYSYMTDISESGSTAEMRSRDCAGERKESQDSTVKRNEINKPSHRYNCMNCGKNFLGNWLDWETRELLQIRAEEEIHARMSGTVRDAAVYATIAEMLAERGIVRSKKQVQSKLKWMKIQYKKITHHSNKNGRDGKEWPFLHQCNAIWGNRPPTNPSSTQSSTQASNQYQGTLTPPSPESPADRVPVDEEVRIHSLPDMDGTGNEGARPRENWPLMSASGPKLRTSASADPPDFSPAPDLGEVHDEGDSPATVTHGPASDERRGVGGRLPRRRVKKTKMEQAAGVMCGVLMDRLEALEEKREEREERRLREERDFQLRLHQEALDMQLHVLREMKSAQAHFLQQLQQLLGRFSQPQTQTQQQPQ
ncbi:hypothetical protein MATL_G00178730 [Megalops atlanticus]|uniref:Myb/SANT-like DNA-binding domain-containing protein n=1 Tax=Megalops atlanticus TaxID=7932 RepID=A0A9D3PNZ8_MEGAT|nr:hypothetical protein MATL_G00178730 [Megalops atlanticus]